jgi:hypothetical protein
MYESMNAYTNLSLVRGLAANGWTATWHGSPKAYDRFWLSLRRPPVDGCWLVVNLKWSSSL